MKIFKNGFLTGLTLQFAIGPVFFFVMNLTLQRSIFDGLVAVLAVTVVDYLYIILAVIGVGKILEKNKTKKVFAIISSIILIIFGLFIIKNILDIKISNMNIGSVNILSSFMSAFLFTIASPMTIIFFASLFASKVIEYGYTKKDLYIFGFSTGLATLIFMGSFVIIFSLLKVSIPIILIEILNIIVGCLLVLYGGVGLAKTIKSKI